MQNNTIEVGGGNQAGRHLGPLNVKKQPCGHYFIILTWSPFGSEYLWTTLGSLKSLAGLAGLYRRLSVSLRGRETRAGRWGRVFQASSSFFFFPFFLSVGRAQPQHSWLHVFQAPVFFFFFFWWRGGVWGKVGLACRVLGDPAPFKKNHSTHAHTVLVCVH